MRDRDIKPIKGVVVARKCDCCGHHEIGVETADGQYTSLTPGMTIEIVETEHTNEGQHG